jgi:hypothetical protein
MPSNNSNRKKKEQQRKRKAMLEKEGHRPSRPNAEPSEKKKENREKAELKARKRAQEKRFLKDAIFKAGGKTKYFDSILENVLKENSGLYSPKKKKKKMKNNK